MAIAMKSAGREQMLLFGVMLAIAVGNTGLQSVLPALGRDLGLPDTLIGFAFSLSSLIWALAAPFWARRLDRTGYKAMVVLGLGGFVCATTICGLSLTAAILGLASPGIAIVFFIIGRCVYGFVGAAAPPAAQAIVAAHTSRADRTNALTMLASAFGVGTIIGPALAPFFVLPVVGLAGPLFIFAVLGGLMLLTVSLLLADVRPSGDPHGAAAEEPVIGGEPGDSSVAAASDDHRVTIRLRDPRIWPWLAIGLVCAHTQAVVGQTMAFLIIDQLAMPPTLAQPFVGMVLMGGALASLFAQWGIIPRLGLAPRQLVLLGALLAAIGSLGIAFQSSFHAVALSFAITSLGYGLIRPGFTAGSSLAVSEDEQGVVAGHVTSVNGFAFMIAPSAGIFMYGLWHPLPYLVCVAVLMAVLLYGWRRLAGVAIG